MGLNYALWWLPEIQSIPKHKRAKEPNVVEQTEKRDAERPSKTTTTKTEKLETNRSKKLQWLAKKHRSSKLPDHSFRRSHFKPSLCGKVQCIEMYIWFDKQVKIKKNSFWSLAGWVPFWFWLDHWLWLFCKLLAGFIFHITILHMAAYMLYLWWVSGNTVK